MSEHPSANRRRVDLGRLHSAVGSRAPFLIAGERTVSYGEIDDHTARLSTLFAELEVDIGSPVMVITQDASAVAHLGVGIVQSGRCLAVIDPAGTAREIRSALVVVEPALVFADRETIHRCELDVDCGWRVIELSAPRRTSLADRLLAKKRGASPATVWPALMNSYAPAAELPAVDPEQTAVIVFTSGSTRRAKGVELSLRAIVAHFETLYRVFDFENARIVNVLPMSHVDGLMMGPLLTYYSGAVWLRPTEFTIAAIPDILDSIYRHRATHMLVVPTMLALFDRLASDQHDAFTTDDFRMIISSAGPLSQALWERFERSFAATVCNSYGLSETVTSSIASGPPASGTRKVGTIGRPIDCLVQLVDDDDQIVAPGEIGEIVITGDHLFSRYRGDHESTIAVLTGRRFRTGDLARQDEDGFIELQGRKSSMIVRGGRNISPLEIDGVIGQIVGVVHSVSVGVDDEMWGQRLESVVVAEASVTVESVVAHCRKHLAAYKVPQHVHLVDSLPVTASGKIDVTAVLDLVAKPVPRISGQPIDLTVLAAASVVFGVPNDKLSLSSTIDEIDGWDSLAHLDLVGSLESTFDIEMTNADILGIRNLADAAQVVHVRVP